MSLLKLEELIKTYSNGVIPYPILIKTKEWIDKRAAIIKRDKETCQNCKIKGFDSYSEDIEALSYHKGKYYVLKEDSKIHKNNIIHIPEVWSKKESLHVHHKLYYYDPLIKKHVYPWLYKDEELITLCSKCHEEEHKNNPPQTLHKDSLKNIPLTTCERCDGMGILHEFLHVENGICFKCRGAKYEEVKINEELIIDEEKLKARKIFEKEWEKKFTPSFLDKDKDSKYMYCKNRINGFSKTDAFMDVFEKEYSFYFASKEFKDKVKDTSVLTFDKDNLSGENYCKHRMNGVSQEMCWRSGDVIFPNTPFYTPYIKSNKTRSQKKSRLNISHIITIGLGLYIILGLTIGIGRALINDFFGTLGWILYFVVTLGVFYFFWKR